MVEQRNKNNFVIDESFVEQSISKLPSEPDLDAFPVTLSANQRVGEAVWDGCICTICTNVVWQAK